MRQIENIETDSRNRPVKDCKIAASGVIPVESPFETREEPSKE